MKRLLYILIFTVSLLSMTSCLKAGLEELPAFSNNEMLAFTFTYRYITEEDRMSVTTMKGKTVIDKENSTVTCDVVVPPANATLPEEQRELVKLENLLAYCSISTAATIKPIGNSPTLGKMQDWSVEPIKYKIIAADGSERVWTVIINSFSK